MTETTTALPTWDDMSDVDKGAALLHLHKREWEGAEYATTDYPVEYFDHPALLALDKRAACRHAAGLASDADTLSATENERLYDLALAEPDRRCLWAARDDRGNPKPISYVKNPGRADVEELLARWAESDDRYVAMDPPPNWWTPADRSRWVVLHRGEWGGQWHEVGGCAGCRE